MTSEAGRTRIPNSQAMVLPLGLAILVGLAFSAHAQERADWEFTIAPYLWGSSLSGRVGTLPGLPPADVDASFRDILDNLDAGAMIVGNANDERLGVTLDLQWIDLKAKTDDLAPLYGETTLDVTNRVASLSFEYLVSEADAHELWLAAGARYWSVETGLSLDAGANPATSLSGSDDWVDPMIGARGSFDASERFYLTGWLYAGGFGVGSDSMADLFGGVGYRFTPVTKGVLGYRWLSVDRDTDDFLYDVQQNGLLLGLSFTF